MKMSHYPLILASLLPRSTAHQVAIPAGMEAVDLFGNPVAKGTPLDERLVYMSGSLGAAELEERLAK